MTGTTGGDGGRAGELMRFIARVTDPLMRPLAGRRYFKLWAIVHHVGRRTGTHYATPVAIVATSDGFVIPLPWGERTQWARNVLDAAGCRVRWGGADIPLVEPQLIGRDQAQRFFNPVLRTVLRTFRMGVFLRLRKAPSASAPD
jgi:deazaflavin-dependent oxidoreductase (nitroreductase family)